MKIKTKQFVSCINIAVAGCIAVSIICISGIMPLSTFAQPPVTTATNTNNTPLRVCTSIPCTDEYEVLTKPSSINADMMTIERDITTAYVSPGTYGIAGTPSNYIQLFGVTYSGISNGNLTAGYTGFTVNTDREQINAPGGGSPFALPYWGLGLSSTANDADIAIGSRSTYVVASPPGIAYPHYALVVYEMDDEIWIERYLINVNSLGVVLMDPLPAGGTGCTPSGNPVFPCTGSLFARKLIGQKNEFDPNSMTFSNGDNSRPHIDIWHEESVAPATGNVIVNDHYVVTWQKDIGGGNYEVWAMTGHIDFLVFGAAFKIADGKHPDVNAVTDVAGIMNPKRAYITYVSSAGDELGVERINYGSTTVGPTAWTNAVYTVGPGELSYPRIAGPKRYNYVAPSNEPLASIVVNDASGGIDAVTSVKVYDGGITSTPDVQPDITSDGSPGFSNSSPPQIAIMPVISGVGSIVSSLAGAPAYSDYPVEFYSDLTTGAGSNGDYYAFGVPLPSTVTNPNLPGGTYMEVNVNPIDYSLGSMSTSDLPALAVATANNTGYDLISAFFEGDNPSGTKQITVGFNGGGAATYTFKPGRPVGIVSEDKIAFATYPNPVKDVLNIVHAKDATYTITNMMGQSLSTGKLTGNKAHINTTNLIPGVYFLQLNKDGHSEKVKFVKQ